MNEPAQAQQPQIRVTGAQWHKIVALLIRKFDLGHVILTKDDIRSMGDVQRAEGLVVMMDEEDDGIHVYLLNAEAAKALAAEREAKKKAEQPS